LSFEQVATVPVEIQRYSPFAPATQMEKAQRLLKALKKARVVHVSASFKVGGVPEILKSLVPMMSSFVGSSSSGPDTQWIAMDGPQEFFQIARRLHHLLQGAGVALTKDELDAYVNYNAQVARELYARGIEADVWVLHDPQTLPLTCFLPPGSHIVWVCHIDTTRPNQRVLQQLLPFMQQATRCVFSMPQYAPAELSPERVCVIPPAIDPLTPKNQEPDLASVKATLAGLRLDPRRPLIAQVSRFDRWKDPWGVIDAYRLVKPYAPMLQLALVGVIDSHDDPEAFSVLESVREHRRGDPDIHLFSDPMQVGECEVAAFQKGADVVVQKSVREGFGLGVAEAMWKGTPVVGGNCGGISLQIEHGRTGFLVNSIEECASRLAELLRDPKQGRWMGAAGKESVRQQFLMPRLLVDYLTLFEGILSPHRNGSVQECNGVSLDPLPKKARQVSP
jgi:trehalose synthase